MQPRIRAVLAAAGAVWTPSVPALGAQQPVDPAIRAEVIQRAATAFQRATALEGRYAARDTIRKRFAVEPRADLPIRPVWVAFPATSHPPYFLVGECEGRLVPLGGFAHPDLAGIAPCVRSDSTGVARLRDLARSFATLADPGGAFETAGMELVTGDANSVARATWRERRPYDWPADSMFTSAEGEVFVTRTTFTAVAPGSTSYGWQATAFTFLFRDGRLSSWQARPGPLLPYRTSDEGSCLSRECAGSGPPQP